MQKRFAILKILNHRSLFPEIKDLRTIVLLFNIISYSTSRINQKINYSVQKVWTTPHFEEHFLDDIAPIINTKVNSWRRVISLSLGNCKTTLHIFFVRNTFISNTRPRFDSKQYLLSKGVKRKKNINERFEDLLSKEHYCYKIHTLPTKSSVSLLL